MCVCVCAKELIVCFARDIYNGNCVCVCACASASMCVCEFMQALVRCMCSVCVCVVCIVFEGTQGEHHAHKCLCRHFVPAYLRTCALSTFAVAVAEAPICR